MNLPGMCKKCRNILSPFSWHESAHLVTRAINTCGHTEFWLGNAAGSHIQHSRRLDEHCVPKSGSPRAEISSGARGRASVVFGPSAKVSRFI